MTCCRFLERAVTSKQPLLIIAKDVIGAALNNILVNIIQKTVECCVIKAPNFGDLQTEELIDISTVVGGRVINTEAGNSLSNSDAHCLGGATR